jgi:hypothetical protein
MPSTTSTSPLRGCATTSAAALAEHDVSPVAIASLEVTGDEQSLHEWLGGAHLPLHVTEGSPALCAVVIRTVDGDRVLR